MPFSLGSRSARIAAAREHFGACKKPRLPLSVTKSPFELTAVYNDRHNYYLTTRKWVERFEQNRDEIRAKYGERAYRMFRLYLAGATVGLDHPSHLATAYRIFLEMPADTR